MLAESVHERPWPGADWDHADISDAVDADRLDTLLDRCLAGTDEFGLTLALVVVHGGRIVRERYGPDTGADTTLISWSMAKSITHALVGLLVEDGRLDLRAPAPIGAWAYDERASITLQHLLEMTSGLEFVEDYEDAGVSHVIEMLFGSGSDDHAAYASAFPAVAPPGRVWNYSSGTSNIIAKIAGDAIGGGRDGTEKYLRERLFRPLGMSSASVKFDTAGTFVGSSYVYATARDFARFGYLYLRDGWWDGRRLLPAGWVDHAATPVPAPIPDDERHGYGAHWWLWRRDPRTLAALGYEGQRTIVPRDRDLVVVRLGTSAAERYPALDGVLDEIVRCFPTAAG
ncbi:MAG: serine hydrolase domain-containing protein [Acidimicrobiia bacterium]